MNCIPSDNQSTALTPERIIQTLTDTLQRYSADQGGAVAGYIPELAKVDPSLFALSVVTVNGDAYTVGDAEHLYALESLSKPFVYALALEDNGEAAMTEKVGVRNTGLPFNSIIDSAVRMSRRQNPLGNAGAMATTSLILGKNTAKKWERVQLKMEDFIGRMPELDKTLYESEMATNARNRALAELYTSYGLFYSDVDDAVERYTKACSLMVTNTELATMGAVLAAGGKNPLTGKRVLSRENVRHVLSVMMIYGFYDDSGDWLFHVGLPGKTGVSGGVLAVVPGKFAIAAYSPPLDAVGNSVRGMKALKDVLSEWDCHLLA